MEGFAAFGISLQRNDHLMSMDVLQGYRHFRLAPKMREWFLFYYDGRYYRCIALPFGWRRSPLRFTELMIPSVRSMREWGYRVLAYLDDFLVSPSPIGTESTPLHYLRARGRISELLRKLGITRHPEKGEWVGANKLNHLDVHVDTEQMTFSVIPCKADRVRLLASV